MTAATHPIGEVVEQTGLSHHTLRFYERERLLLGEIARDGAGRRRYSAADLEWIGLCTKLRESRMPLEEIRELAGLIRAGAGTEPERLALLVRHQRRIRHQLAELDQALAQVTSKVDRYREYLATGEPAHLWDPTAAD